MGPVAPMPDGKREEHHLSLPRGGGMEEGVGAGEALMGKVREGAGPMQHTRSELLSEWMHWPCRLQQRKLAATLRC